MILQLPGDRAIEITRAFVEEHFTEFDRVVPSARSTTPACCSTTVTRATSPSVSWLPRRRSSDTSSEWFSRPASPVRLLETQKFGHVTTSGTATARTSSTAKPGRKSPATSCLRATPWMKAAEITDAMIAAAVRPVQGAVRCNLRQRGHGRPHRQLPAPRPWRSGGGPGARRRLLLAIDAAGGVAIGSPPTTGNADEIFELDKKTRQPRRTRTAATRPRPRHAQPGAADPLRQRHGGKIPPEAARDHRPVEHRRHGGQPAPACTKHDKWDDSLLEWRWSATAPPLPASWSVFL